VFSMKNSLRLLVLVACFCLLAGVAAAATLTISVFPSIGPSPFGSPSYAAYQASAVNALELGQTTFGTSGTPSYYAQTSTFNGAQIIGTCSVATVSATCPPGSGFNSWMGQASPSGNYANEYGNMLFFGMIVQGNGTPFDLNEISFQDTFYNTTTVVEQLSTVGFGSGRLIGIYAGGTCTSLTCDANTPLSSLYFSGFGDQFTDFDSTTFASAITTIQAATAPYSTGVYSLTVNGTTYKGEADLTPEPGTMALAGLGLLLAGVFRKRLI
jgi:hypothetical protein